MLDQLLEVALGRLQGLLEGRADLAIGVADQPPQLGQRRLQVATLLLELADVLQGLRVLLLRQGIDGAEGVAPARQPLQLALDLLALLGAKLLLRGVDPATEPLTIRSSSPRSSSCRSRSLVALTSASVTESPPANSFACSSASAREQARSSFVHVVPVAVGEHPALELGRALAHRVPGIDRRRQQGVEPLEQLGRGPDAVLERALTTLAEQGLDAPGAAGRALGRLADPSHVGGPTLARPRCGRARARPGRR